MTRPVKPVINVIRLRGVPILEQLKLEEALFRCDNRNWCILNSDIRSDYREDERNNRIYADMSDEVNINHKYSKSESPLRNSSPPDAATDARHTPGHIVMGISAQVRQLLNVEAVKKDGIEVIKRYTGGGTVLVDKDTLFASLIFNWDEVQPDESRVKTREKDVSPTATVVSPDQAMVLARDI